MLALSKTVQSLCCTMYLLFLALTASDNHGLRAPSRRVHERGHPARHQAGSRLELKVARPSPWWPCRLGEGASLGSQEQARADLQRSSTSCRARLAPRPLRASLSASLAARLCAGSASASRTLELTRRRRRPSCCTRSVSLRHTAASERVAEPRAVYDPRTSSIYCAQCDDYISDDDAGARRCSITARGSDELTFSAAPLPEPSGSFERAMPSVIGERVSPSPIQASASS